MATWHRRADKGLASGRRGEERFVPVAPKYCYTIAVVGKYSSLHGSKLYIYFFYNKRLLIHINLALCVIWGVFTRLVEIQLKVN